MKIKYNRIGVNYNRTRKADPFLVDRFLHFLNPNPNGLYLDIGCGTGNYTIAIQSKGFHFIGIDPSQKMLDKAEAKNKFIDWKIGRAENTGLQNECIDGAMASLTLHHWSNLELEFKELYRVLKPNTSIVIFTATPKQMKGYWLQHYFPKMLEDSIKQMPTFQNIKNAMEHAGFSISQIETYAIKPDLKDLFLYSGKQHPEYYLNSEIRSGISSFSDLANSKEINQGLKNLKSDIESNKIDEIIKSYENDLGDYLFIIGQKE